MNPNPKPPWCNHIKGRGPKAYCTELPKSGAKHAYYNVIGTNTWVEWVDGKWVNVNPAWIHAEYECVFYGFTPEALARFHIGPPPIGIDLSKTQDISVILPIIWKP